MELKSEAILFLCLASLCCVQISVVNANWLTNLFSHSDSEDAHGRVFSENARPHQHSWTHELIAAAAGFEAMRAYENHVARQNGVAPSHSIMKDLLAGFAAAAADRLFETHGLDWLDRQRVTDRATKNAHHVAGEKYGEGNSGNFQEGQDGQDRQGEEE